MQLCLDLGNTRVKWGLRAVDAPFGAWAARGAVTHAEVPMLAAAWQAAAASITQVCACRVATPTVVTAVGAALAAAAITVPIDWRQATAATAAGVRNDYEQPQRLGADRWAAVVGAWSGWRQPALVVSAGTATTVDLLLPAAGGGAVFSGGYVLPGVAMMLRALADETAQLPLADGHFCARPRNTADAIVSGCLAAQVGAVVRLARELPEGGLVVLTGGAAERLAPLLQAHFGERLRHTDTLVLDGLAGLVAAD